MDAARWVRVQMLFAEALTVPSESRDGWLADACHEDSALYDEVASLLQADSDDSPLLARLERLGEASHARRAREESDDASLAPPDAVGRFTIERELGRGGMGIVYLARAADVSVPVALKLVRTGRGAHERMLRLAREARVLARLAHPCIARFVESGSMASGTPFLAMEYLDGEPVAHYCASHALATRARVQLMIAACDALMHAHARGVVHRDLKPAHLLVRVDGTVAVLDFGIAKIIDDVDTHDILTQPGTSVYTPAYAAREQIAGDAAGQPADVYALGVITYELLTGRLPVDMRSTAERARMVRGDLPAAPSVVAPDAGISPQVDAVLLRALEPAAEKRFASASALRTALIEMMR